MPSTYTANGGIELPADGEQSATWGDTVNDNMSIIDRITNGVGAITLSGTTHTLTTSNGVLSDGQYNVLVLGGSPSGTNTVTVSPNDGQRIYIVKNGSGQTATFTQGSGANVSVLAGTTKIIYCDGTGSGAAVVDLTGSLDLGALIVTGTTVTATGAELNIMGGVTATTAELNIMDGVTASTAELNIMDGVTASTAELNIMDGVTASTAELNILDGVTSTAAEINLLDGVTASTAELNILDGVTATTAELNALDGITATVTELNYTDGVTSAIQTQINAKAALASPALTGTPTAPTAAAATDTTQVATTAMVQAALAALPSSSPVKAWVSFTGSTGAIRASSGVSSVSRNGAGDYSINFTGSLMSDANYASIAFGSEIGSPPMCNLSLVSQSASSCRIRARTEYYGTPTDPAIVNASFMR
jgi:hypothetical protein